MRSNRKRRFINNVLSILASLAALVFVFLLIVVNPQWYYFKDTVDYKNFSIYYDKSLPAQAFSVLDQADTLIKKSPLYQPTLKFKVFLRNDTNKYNLLPFQFFDKGYGRSVQFLSNNIFIFNCNVETNSSYDGMGGTRTLSSVIAHEAVHILIEKKYGYLRSRFGPYFAEHDFSQMRYLWKEEGYAEYIALNDRNIIDFDEGISHLARKSKEQNVHNFEYVKYWLAIKYLLEVEKMTVDTIFETEIDLDEVVSKATKHYMLKEAEHQ